MISGHRDRAHAIRFDEGVLAVLHRPLDSVQPNGAKRMKFITAFSEMTTSRRGQSSGTLLEAVK